MSGYSAARRSYIMAAKWNTGEEYTLGQVRQPLTIIQLPETHQFSSLWRRRDRVSPPTWARHQTGPRRARTGGRGTAGVAFCAPYRSQIKELKSILPSMQRHRLP